MAKVLITPRSFGKYSDRALQLLVSQGIEIVKDPSGGILNEDQLCHLIGDVDGIIVGVDPLSEQVLKNAPKLVAISKYGVGVDNIDCDYAQAHDIKVDITLGANSAAVADYAFALLLAVARNVVKIDCGCRRGDWTKTVSIDVYGKKLGVLGLGAIGRGVVSRAKGFDMEICGYDIYRDDAYITSSGIEFCSIDTILETCDFISIHLPLTEATHHLIDRAGLAKMKPTAVIINTARGAIIDEDDLYAALFNHTIYGAGIDVFEHEPAEHSKLLALDNVVVGSHCAASTEGAVNQMSLLAAENIVNVFRKKGLIHG